MFRPMIRKRTARRQQERAARRLVRDREKLASLSPGGSDDHPIAVTSASVIEVRARALPCVQCDGEYKIREHASAGSGLRRVEVTCQQCGTPRTLWFRLISDDPN
jgi:hypothetical protein